MNEKKARESESVLPRGWNPSFLYGALLVLVLGGYAVHLRWILGEMARLEPLEIFLIWTGDAFGILLSLDLILGGWRRRLGRERTPVPASIRIRFLILAILATGADATGAILGLVHDARRFERAAETTGQITRYRNRQKLVLVDLEYAHPTRGTIRACENGDIHHLRTHVPAPIMNRLEKGPFPVEVPLRYDPEKPMRVWLGYAKPKRPNSVYFWSLLVLLFQFILCLFSASPVTYFVLDHLKIGVLGLQAFFLWFMFLVDLISGMRP